LTRDPLSVFFHEKTADSAPTTSNSASVRNITDNPDRDSLDPGERAMAGLAAVSGSIAAKAVPFISRVVAKPLSEVGTVEAIVPRADLLSSRFMGLFKVSPRIRADLAIASPIFTDKMNEIAPVVESFMNKHKLIQKGVTVNFHRGALSGLVGPNYNVATKTVNFPIVGKAIALHELGHAADYTAGRIGKIRRFAEPILQRGVLTALPIALVAGDRIKEILPGTIDDKAIEFMQDHAPEILGATLAATQLYPEAKATGLALRHIAKVEGRHAAVEALKKLAPAFGTYLLGAIPAVVGMALARKYMREARGEKAEVDSMVQQQMRELEKTSAILGETLKWGCGIAKDIGNLGRQVGVQTAELLKGPNLLRRIGQGAREVGTSPEFVMGSVASAIPATLGALYLYGTPAGKEVRQRISPEQLESSYTKRPKGVPFTQKVDDSWREQHPMRYAGLVAAGAALSGGILSKFFGDLLKVL